MALPRVHYPLILAGVNYFTISSALTTIFTPDAGCRDRLFTKYPDGYHNADLLLHQAIQTRRIAGCHPPVRYDAFSLFASPGICPLGYSIDKWEYKPNSTGKGGTVVSISTLFVSGLETTA